MRTSKRSTRCREQTDQQARCRSCNGDVDKLTTTNKRNKERRVGGVRDANDRSERRDIWPGARGGGRVRELAQTERAPEQQQQREKRGKRATSEQQQQREREREREGRTEGGLSRQNHIVPRSLLPQGQYRMWNDHAVRSRELQQICLQSCRRE